MKDEHGCQIEDYYEEMMSAVVGRPVHRTSCRHGDDPCSLSCVPAACCAFAIVDE